MLAFATSPLYGVWSDARGRRYPIAIAAFGVGLPHIAYAFTGSVSAYVAGTAISGLFFVTLPLAFAYVADTVRPAGRAAAVGALMAMFGLSMAGGPLLGGLMAAQYGSHSVFWLSTLLTVMAVLYVLAVMPESVPPAPVGHIDWSLADPFDALKQLVQNRLLRRLAGVALLYYLSLWTVISQILLYTQRQFEFTPKQTGALLMIVGIGMMISEGILLRLMVCCMSERHILIVALSVFAIFLFLLGIATEGWHVYTATCLSLVYGMTQPALTSLVSHATPANRQGQVQGAINSVRAIAEGVAPVFAGVAMLGFEGTEFPGAPFVFCSALVVAAVFVAVGIDTSEPTTWLVVANESGSDDENWDENNQMMARKGDARARST